jgi:hypothetical protein
LDRFDEVQVLVAVYAAQHDVIDRERVGVGERRDRAELTARDLADHAVTARSELYGFASREPRDVAVCPSHEFLRFRRKRSAADDRLARFVLGSPERSILEPCPSEP